MCKKKKKNILDEFRPKRSNYHKLPVVEAGPGQIDPSRWTFGNERKAVPITDIINN